MKGKMRKIKKGFYFRKGNRSIKKLREGRSEIIQKLFGENLKGSCFIFM